MIDLTAAETFMATHTRLLDRRRFAWLLGHEPEAGTLAALAAYRNPDGGFGWGLEPDLRSATSQPAGALHALELLEEIATGAGELAVGLCDWLDSVTLEDGGLPFALPGADAPGSAPWWAAASPTASSLHITAAVCAAAQRLATHDPALATHPWLARATEYCRAAIGSLAEPGGAYELRYALWLLDAIEPAAPEARAELERLAAFVPASGERRVEGGTANEKLRPLDFAPSPERPLRRYVAEQAIERDLDRIERTQRDDGGWDIDFATSSPASRLEWRGHVTVHALQLLAANGRLAR